MSIGSISKRLIVFCLFIFVVKVSFARETESIRSKVYDNTTNKELPGVNVVLKGTTIGAASDLDRNFILRNVPVGKKTVTITYVKCLAVLSTAQEQQSAIQQQLSSDKISNVVSEQRIKPLPDLNAAQTISRLTGVSTTQSSSEDNKIIDLTSISLYMKKMIAIYK